jgi:hypothetical protein
LWVVSADGKAMRLEMMGGTLYTPQWVAFADPVDAVRVVADSRSDLPAAEAYADALRTRGLAVRIGVGSPGRCGDKLHALSRTKRPKKKAVKS